MSRHTDNEIRKSWAKTFVWNVESPGQITLEIWMQRKMTRVGWLINRNSVQFLHKIYGKKTV